VTGQPVTEGGGCPLPAEGAYTAFTVHLAGLPGYPRTVAGFCRHHGPSFAELRYSGHRNGPVKDVARRRLDRLTARLDRVPPGGLYLRPEYFDACHNPDVRCDGPNDVARLDDPALAGFERDICRALGGLALLTDRAAGAGPIGNEHRAVEALRTVRAELDRLTAVVEARAAEGKG
jgi:hypothetical protein